MGGNQSPSGRREQRAWKGARRVPPATWTVHQGQTAARAKPGRAWLAPVRSSGVYRGGPRPTTRGFSENL